MPIIYSAEHKISRGVIIVLNVMLQEWKVKREVVEVMKFVIMPQKVSFSFFKSVPFNVATLLYIYSSRESKYNTYSIS